MEKKKGEDFMVATLEQVRRCERQALKLNKLREPTPPVK
ncbi:hypothetical protein NOC27_521 [Nitrosococcus oceani AFC27]|nr:hypothetical protein NOC27_521 [Nitrosococcus oceani AFC27]